MVILVIIGLVLIAYGCYLFLKAFWKLILALYYRYFADDKNIDEGFKKHVVAETPEYKQFKKNIERGV